MINIIVNIKIFIIFRIVWLNIIVSIVMIRLMIYKIKKLLKIKIKWSIFCCKLLILFKLIFNWCIFLIVLLKFLMLLKFIDFLVKIILKMGCFYMLYLVIVVNIIIMIWIIMFINECFFLLYCLLWWIFGCWNVLLNGFNCWFGFVM